MIKFLHCRFASMVLLSLVLSACGGGGEGAGGSSGIATVPEPVVSPAKVTWPSSGEYSPVLTTEGAIQNPTLGLTLVHSATPNTQYVVQSATTSIGGITDLQFLYSGSTDVGTAVVNHVKPHAMIYITGGNLKTMNLAADGTDPRLKIKSSGSTQLCRIKSHLRALDFDSPNNSRLFASTKGVDGICDSADDGEASITFSSSDVPIVFLHTGVSNALGVMRNPQTLKPDVVVFPNTISFSTATLALVVNSSPRITKVISQSSHAVVAERSDKSLVVISSVGMLTTLDAVVTAGAGWADVGYDENNFYVSRTTGNLNQPSGLSAATWKLIKISSANPTASVLASGTGTLVSASMGKNVVFTSILTTSGNTSNVAVSRINKAGSGSPTVIATAGNASMLSTLSGANGIHMLIRFSGVNTSHPSSTLSIIDETGSVLYTSVNAFPSGMIEPSRIKLATSENRDIFTFYTRFGSLGHNGAELKAYDTSTKRLINLGTLPGVAEFDSLPAFANNSFERTGFLGGFIGPIQNSAIPAGRTKVFTFDTTIENSLKIVNASQ